MPDIIRKSDLAFRRKAAPIAVAVLALVGVAAVVFYLYARSQVERRNDLVCAMNMKEIGFALITHHDLTTRFPARDHIRKGAPPGLSWRVAICQYLEEGEDDELDYDHLCWSFRHDEPWDSAANLKLANQRPAELVCPSLARSSRRRTTYFAVAGPDTCWPEGEGIRISDSADGTSHTGMVAESHDLDAVWSQPRDRSLDVMRASGDKQREGLSSAHPGSRVHIAMADGAVRTVSANIDTEVVQQLFNRHDGVPDSVAMNSWDQ